MPLVWIAAYSGAISYPTLAFDPFISPLHWHMHEMFFGFGWGTSWWLSAHSNEELGGHSWSQWPNTHPPHHIVALRSSISGIWRGLAIGSCLWPIVPVHRSLVTVLLEIDLIRNHAKDSYRDNAYFILALPLFVAAKFALSKPRN